MPAEEARLAGVYIRCHCPRPVGPGNASQAAHHGVHDVREPVTALQCITAVASSARDLRQLASCLAMDGWQVVRIARHLGGLREPACNLFSFLCIHITLSHKSIGLSRSLLLAAWRLPLAACFSSRIFLFKPIAGVHAHCWMRRDFRYFYSCIFHNVLSTAPNCNCTHSGSRNLYN